MSGAPGNRVVVVGAGMVGLSVAWFLQEHGAEVCVIDRAGVAAGASWGNAGWLSPALAVPLPEPGVLRYGLRALLDPDAALAVRARPDPALWAFLLRFARHCTWPKWRRAMASYVEINRLALGAYDALLKGGVSAETLEAPIVVGSPFPAEQDGLERELGRVAEAGQEVVVRTLTGSELRAALPQASDHLRLGLRIDGQRYLDPGAFTAALADAVVQRGGRLRTGFTARALRHGPGGITVEAFAGEPERAGIVVLATGSWLPELARPLGVRVPLQAGRGYSFSVEADEPVPGPLYLPASRVACTPYRGRLRVAGTMELAHRDAPLDPGRIASIVRAARPFLSGVRWESMSDPWVGPRPLTSDGLPLIGRTRAPGVYVAGGHGMWGITLGPVTGKLLAEQIVTGKTPDALTGFDPLRSAPWRSSRRVTHPRSHLEGPLT